jgi:hypothetical protein
MWTGRHWHIQGTKPYDEQQWMVKGNDYQVQVDTWLQDELADFKLRQSHTI